MIDERRLPAEIGQVVTSLPDSDVLARALRDGVNAAIARLETERPQTGQREDFYPTVRWMQSTAERLHEYALAFESGAATVRQYAEELLAQAVPVENGVPRERLVVPDADGDIVIKPNVDTKHDVDRDTLFPVVAAITIDSGRGTEPVQTETESDDEYVARYEDWMSQEMVTAISTAVELGGASYKPGVTKVRALADQLARAGSDGLSAQLNGAISTTRKLKDVTMGRKT